MRRIAAKVAAEPQNTAHSRRSFQRVCPRGRKSAENASGRKASLPIGEFATERLRTAVARLHGAEVVVDPAGLAPCAHALSNRLSTHQPSTLTSRVRECAAWNRWPTNMDWSNDSLRAALPPIPEAKPMLEVTRPSLLYAGQFSLATKMPPRPGLARQTFPARGITVPTAGGGGPRFNHRGNGWRFTSRGLRRQSATGREEKGGAAGRP